MTVTFGQVELDPVALGSQGNAILGIRDSGKTYTAMELAEIMMEAGIPIFAFDPVGVWRYLRVPGAGRGYPVVVAGGREGDLPLTPESVPDLVEAAMKSGVSLVFDLFDINLSKADWRRIVMAALRTLLHENHQYGLRHVFIEEAAEFAPQKVMDGHVYAEMEKLARMGGNARLGYTLINQRSEEVNKALLELCDNLFLHRQKGRNSLTALSKWLDIGNVTDHRKIVGSLSTLPTGQCWAWLEGSDTPILTTVPPKNSFHPDRRVMRGDAEAPTQAKPVDVGAFVQAMKAQLAKPVAAPAAAKAIAAAPDPKLIEAAEQRGREAGFQIGYAQGVGAALGDLQTWVVGRLEDILPGPVEPPPSPPVREVTASAPISPPNPEQPNPERPIVRTVATPGTIGTMATRLLIAARQAPRPEMTWQEVAILAGVSAVSGPFHAAKRDLLEAGCFSAGASGLVTPDEWTGKSADSLAADQVVETWATKLGGMAARFLRHIYTSGPRTKLQTATDLGVSPQSGPFHKGWKQLRESGLTVNSDGQTLEIAPIIRQLAVPELKPRKRAKA